MGRWWLRWVISAAFLLVTTVAVAAPASAVRSWEPVTFTADFHCTTTTSPTGIETRTCVVVRGNQAQAVVTVANFSMSTISIEAPNLRLVRNGTEILYDVSCPRTDLDRGMLRGCFGPTRTIASGSTVQARAQVKLVHSTGWDGSPTWRI